MSLFPVNPSVRIRADLSQRALVLPHDYQWVASPQPGVERVMLDRDGAETGRATSLVRYASGSAFPQHCHPRGEEILVLQGTFSEDGRHHGAGMYLRNPPGSAHAPASAPGTIIFVKLGQMPESEGAPVLIDTHQAANWEHHDGREVCRLYAGSAEQVTLERISPGMTLLPTAVEGAEALVLSGELQEDGETYPSGTWLRLPPHETPAPIKAGEQGATVYLKTGHLAEGSGVD